MKKHKRKKIIPLCENGHKLRNMPFTNIWQCGHGDCSFYIEKDKKENEMSIELARQIAAQAWCTPETSGIEMDTRLAEAFADILNKEWANALNENVNKLFAKE